MGGNLMMDRTNEGKRVELVFTNDPYTKLPNGAQGTIQYSRFDGYDTVIAVNWDDGSSLSLIEGTDRYRILD
jgi:hypothetical protein